MIRKLFLIALAFLAARMARKALRREAEVVSLLWTLIQVTLAAGANTAKARSTESRLSTLVPRIPFPQATPGGAANNSYGPTNNSYGPANNSYTVSNNSYDLNSGTDNIGAADNNGVTSGQIGGAAAHYHDMHHGHVYGNLASDFNALRDTVSSLIPAFNTHINDHGALVNTISALRTDHSNLLTTVSTLRTDHSNLLSGHNSLVGQLQNTKILH
jgi:hypothetical protein